jgi:hypothetical protein
MSDRNWQEQQRRVLNRLFDSVFERREAPKKEIDEDIQRLGSVDKRLD